MDRQKMIDSENENTAESRARLTMYNAGLLLCSIGVSWAAFGDRGAKLWNDTKRWFEEKKLRRSSHQVAMHYLNLLSEEILNQREAELKKQ